MGRTKARIQLPRKLFSIGKNILVLLKTQRTVSITAEASLPKIPGWQVCAWRNCFLIKSTPSRGSSAHLKLSTSPKKKKKIFFNLLQPFRIFRNGETGDKTSETGLSLHITAPNNMKIQYYENITSPPALTSTQ